jgi:hypothetical protein
MNIFGAPFHASYGRASVDALSNFVEFPEFDFEGDIHAFFRRKPDPDGIPLFLHEATHHWCFDTPIFWALYILQFRALGGLCKIAKKQQVVQWDIIDDIYRCRAVTDLYRPIIEGLALFAEYVALPRGRFIYSHPFSQVTALCDGWLKEELEGEEQLKAAMSLVMVARKSTGSARKKAGLLSMPFDPGGSPYLTGHMLVCSIWRAMLMQGVSMFTNTDAFLSYLRSYFFFDYELIAILMNNELHETAIVQAVAQHLQLRILRLFNPDLSTVFALQDPREAETGTAKDIFERYSIKTLKRAVADWDTNDCVAVDPSRLVVRRTSTWFRKAGISGLDAVFGPIRGVLTDEAKAAKTQKQLIAAFDWLLEETDESEILTSVKVTAFEILRHRPNLALCRCPVRAVIGNGRCVVNLKTATVTMAAATGAQSGEYEARLELVVSSRMVHTFACVYADGKLIGASLPPELIDQEQTGGGVEVHRLSQILREVTNEDASVADSFVPLLIGSYEQVISQAVDHVYDTAFMALFPHADWSAARLKMRENGLLGFESASSAGVRGLARLSHISCLPIPKAAWNALLSEIREDGDSPDPVDEALRFFGPKSMMPLMWQYDTHWQVWV